MIKLVDFPLPKERRSGDDRRAPCPICNGPCEMRTPDRRKENPK